MRRRWRIFYHGVLLPDGYFTHRGAQRWAKRHLVLAYVRVEAPLDLR